MKALSLIVQFVIFFSIGFGFFLLAGNLFRFQSDLIKKDILDSGSELSIKQVSAVSITANTTCKSCDTVDIMIDQKSIAGYTPTYRLSNGIILTIEPESKIIQSTIHNLCRSTTCDSREVTSSRGITLTYDRTNNKLVIR